jgi:hypothetical protein
MVDDQAANDINHILYVLAGHLGIQGEGH